MKHNVILKSGAVGWRGRLHETYGSEVVFEAYPNINGLASRLGYKSTKTAWRANPMIEGGTNPADFRKTPRSKLRK